LKKVLKKFNESPTITTSLLIVLFLLLNWVSYGAYMRFDLSNTGRLRLTDKTKEILKNLPDNVIVEGFFSGEVPASHVQQLKYLKDFLKEYAAVSKGKFQLIFLDPDSDEEAKERADFLGIRSARMGSIDQKKQEISSVYFSIALSYGAENQIINNVLNVRQLEYELTSRIYKMAHPGERKIGFLANHGDFHSRDAQKQTDAFHSLQGFKQTIETVYGNLVDVDTAKNDVPSDITTLVIAGVTKLSPLDMFRIDQYLMRGGKLIVAQSGMNLSFQSGMVTPAAPEIIEFFANYGVLLSSSMIYEKKNFMAYRTRGALPFQVLEIPYPLWVVAVDDYMDKNNIITKELPNLFLPWTSSVSADENKLIKDSDTKASILIKSSKSAYEQSNNVLINPQAVSIAFEQDNQTVSQYNLGVLIEGKFKSKFTAETLPDEAPKDFIKEGERPGMILAVGSPYAISNMGIMQSQGINGSFFLSALHLMNGMKDLVEIRSTEIENPPLPAMEPAKKNTLTMLNFILPLAFFAGFGMIVFYRRKKLAEIPVSSFGEKKKKK